MFKRQFLIGKIFVILIFLANIAAFAVPAKIDAFIDHSNSGAQSTLTTTTNAPSVLLPSPFAHVRGIIPAAPDFDVKGYILVDANSGYVIAEKNADTHLPPASITKLMTLYLVANALKNNQMHFADQVPITENAWHMGGSRMFAKVGSTVSVQDLINGIVIASGNDATVAMAEYLAGTEANFVKIMNETAASLGMKNTHYTDSNGLPASDHYSTARDISVLAAAWIHDYPEYYPWFKERWIFYNKIRQENRNRLLWHDPSVDGIKTGHTDEAGYCLTASAVRNGMRLISVVLGAGSDAMRTNYSQMLLNYGFRFYETHKIFAENVAINKARVWFGKSSFVELGLSEPIYVTVPIGEFKNLVANAVVNKKITAPIVKGQQYGMINFVLNNKMVASKPLLALQDVPRANFLFTLFDRIAILWH